MSAFWDGATPPMEQAAGSGDPLRVPISGAALTPRDWDAAQHKHYAKVRGRCRFVCSTGYARSHLPRHGTPNHCRLSGALRLVCPVGPGGAARRDALRAGGGAGERHAAGPALRSLPRKVSGPCLVPVMGTARCSGCSRHGIAVAPLILPCNGPGHSQRYGRSAGSQPRSVGGGSSRDAQPRGGDTTRAGSVDTRSQRSGREAASVRVHPFFVEQRVWGEIMGSIVIRTG
eukprot:COSAG01_NODE_1001_length_12210_cov_60.505491_15_plen_230_part_00